MQGETHRVLGDLFLCQRFHICAHVVARENSLVDLRINPYVSRYSGHLGTTIDRLHTFPPTLRVILAARRKLQDAAFGDAELIWALRLIVVQATDCARKS